MIVDFDLRELNKLKKGSLLISDGKSFTPIHIDELVKPYVERIEAMERTIEEQNKVIQKYTEKIENFAKAFQGI